MPQRRIRMPRPRSNSYSRRPTSSCRWCSRPPVYRHKSFEFGEARAAGGRIAQRVHIVDDNGEAWEAMYTLEQQADGSLKITGCSLLKAGQAV
jgi:hypothetical protein